MPLQQLSAHGLTWYSLENPEESEVLELQKKFGFHDLDIEDCLSGNERPKLEEHEEYLFCVVHLPVKVGSRIVKEDINVFLGKDFIITLTEGKSSAPDSLWKLLKHSDTKRDDYFEQGSGFFLYKMLDLLFDQGFPLIESLMKDLRRIEVALFENEERQGKMLRDILNLKRNIITMRSMLFPQRSVIAQLQHRNRTLIPSELTLYFDDVSDAIERQWSLLDTAKEMSDALQETHESWLTHRTNEVIRLLTIFSVTMVPLTFVASLYGMNVGLPFQKDPMAFTILAGFMGFILVTLLGYFAWKKWL
jgi:magnesium transporter